MIFVTVGTHEQPFNRLLQKIDELKKDGTIQDDVIIQTGYLFGVNRFQICEVVQYLSATIFLWSFCIDKYKIFDFVSVFLFGIVILISAIIMHDITFSYLVENSI